MRSVPPSLRPDRRGVSPVIGVVVLVAITVMLVAIGGAFLFGLSDSPTPAPELSVEFEYDEVTNEVTLVVEAGGPITEANTGRLVVVVDGEKGESRKVWADSGGSVVDLNSEELASGESFAIDDAVGGDTGDRTLSFELQAGDKIRVVWLGPDEQGNTATLVTDTVPSLASSAPGALDQDGAVAGAGTGAAGDGGASIDVVPTGAQALGNTADVDGDGRNELPYVDSSGDLLVNDSDGETERLVDAGSVSDATPDTDKTLMATAQWGGSPLSVFYSNANHDRIYRVEPGGSPTLVRDLGGGNGVNSVLGPGDIDGDGDDELVYAGDSQGIRYLEPDGSVATTTYTSTGSNNGIGTGPLPDPDGDGTDEAIVVSGSNNLKLVDSSGDERTLATSVSVAKSPATAADVDEDGDAEIVFVVESSEEVRYIDDVGGAETIETLTDEDGNTVTADDDTGVVS